MRTYDEYLIKQDRTECAMKTYNSIVKYDQSADGFKDEEQTGTTKY